MKGAVLLVLLSFVAVVTALTYSDKSYTYVYPQPGIAIRDLFGNRADATSWFPKGAALSLEPTLFFSGFVSAGANKAIALHNPSNVDVKTNRYSIRIVPNGKPLTEAFVFQLQPAVVKAKTTYILALKSSATPAALSKISAPLQSKKFQARLEKYFQHNSVFALFLGKGLVDIIGTPSTVAKFWSVGGKTVDLSKYGIVRLPSVVSGNEGSFNGREWKAVAANAWSTWSKHRVTAASQPFVQGLARSTQDLAVEAILPLDKGVYDIEVRIKFHPRTTKAVTFPIVGSLVGRNLKKTWRQRISPKTLVPGKWVTVKIPQVTCYGKQRAALTLKRYTVFRNQNKYVDLSFDWVRIKKVGEVPKGAVVDITEPYPNQKFAPGSQVALKVELADKPADAQVHLYVNGKDVGQLEGTTKALPATAGRHCVTVQVADDEEVFASDYVCYKVYKNAQSAAKGGKQSAAPSDEDEGADASSDESEYKEDDVTVSGATFTTLTVTWTFSGKADVYIAQQNDRGQVGAWALAGTNVASPFQATKLSAATIYHFAVAPTGKKTFTLDNGVTAGLVRKDVRHLTAEEKKNFIDALFALNANGDYLTQTFRHSAAFSPPRNTPGVDKGVNPAHRGAIFLPWHRYFILDLENKINEQLTKAGKPKMGHPFWRWTSARGSDLWGVFAADFCGATQTGVVRSGPFVPCDPKKPLEKCWKVIASAVNADVVANNYRLDAGGLEREVDTSVWDSNLPSDTYVQQYYASSRASSYLDVVSNVESWHNSLHVSVGGHMAEGRSPNDPVFWLNHVNVDRLWAQWQSTRFPDFSPQSYLTPSSSYPWGISNDMWPWNSLSNKVSFTPMQMLNWNALGFRYADFWDSKSATPVIPQPPTSTGGSTGGPTPRPTPAPTPKKSTGWW